MIARLSANRPLPIGLDIGTDGVRMLQLRRAGSSFRAVACGRWRFPAEAPPPGEARDRMLAEAVDRLHARSGFRGRRVVTALPAGEVQIKNVRIPRSSGPTLRRAVLQEAKERFGFEVRPDSVGFFNAGMIRQGTESREEIIMLAAESEQIAAHIETLERMRLQPEHIDAPPVALFRGYERRLQRKTDQDTVSVLVEIGRSATRVVVARGRSILFIKQIEIGGEQFDAAVADQLDITVPEASALRERILSENRSPSDADDQASADRSDLDWMVHDALRAQVDDLAREIGLCLRYCAVTFRGLRASKITLAGGEANDPTVREVLANHLSLEIRLGNPLKGVDLSAVDLGDDRRTTLADWSVCAGLATFGLFDREALLAAEDRRSGGDDG